MNIVFVANRQKCNKFMRDKQRLGFYEFQYMYIWGL